MKKHVLFLFALSALLHSCSLLKFTIESDVKPLPQNELNTRLAVRSFYQDFTEQVITASDSIIAATDNPEQQINAIKWKLHATSACSKAAYQTVPEASLVDVWVLCLQMNDMMEQEGQTYFGEFDTIATAATDKLNTQIELLSKKLNKKEKHDQLEAFVNDYAAKHPLHGLQFNRKSLLSDLTSYLQTDDSTYVTTVGSGAEVMNDLTERIGNFSHQVKNQVEWEKELLTLKWNKDSLDERFLARADSLSFLLNRLAIIAQESPEMMGIVAVRMREELTPLIYSLNDGINTSINHLSQERALLQKYLDEQRSIITEDINKTGQHMIETATDNLVKLIRRLIVYIILLILVLFGIPFGLGFMLGRVQLRRKKDKTD